METSKRWMIFFSFVIVFVILFLLGFDLLSYLPFLRYLPEKQFNLLKSLINFVVNFGLAMLFLQITSSLIKKYLERKLDKSELKLILSVYTYTFLSLVITVILIILYRRFSTIILSVSIIGFGLTLALQKPILNFVGWLLIIISKPFKIGDRITIGSSGVSSLKGIVYNITPMYTSLAELDENYEPGGKSINVPNEQLISQPVINLTKDSNYIWDELKIKITQQSDYKALKKIMLNSASSIIGDEMKLAIKNLKKQETISKEDEDHSVVKYDISGGSITLHLRYLTDAARKRETKSKINEIIIEEITKRDDIILKGD